MLLRGLAPADSTLAHTHEPVAATVERALSEVAGGAFAATGFGLRFWDGSELGPRGDGPHPTVVIRDPVALLHVAREPNQIGLARAWALGAVELIGNLDDVLELGERAPKARISALDRARLVIAIWRLLGLAAVRRPATPSIEIGDHQGGRHSLRRDRSSVSYHYDAPTEFHRLVIGPSMVYSCAYFAHPDNSLEEAQRRKLDLICRKLRLKPGDRLLDVGCGWGSLVLHAAEHYGVSAVGITLSQAQAVEARERLRRAGPDIAERCEIRVMDYREIDDGPFDAVASVGMYEHVGLAQLDGYAAKVRDLLRPGGLFLNHGITRLNSDQVELGGFMDRFVFPDGELHPVGAFVRALERSGLEIRDAESLRPHYGLTLRRWLANLERHREQAIAIGGLQRERIWRVYLTGSARAFERGTLSVFQVLSVRGPDTDRLPLTRADLLVDGDVPSGPPESSNGDPGAGMGREPATGAARVPVTSGQLSAAGEDTP